MFTIRSALTAAVALAAASAHAKLLALIELDAMTAAPPPASVALTFGAAAPLFPAGTSTVVATTPDSPAFISSATAIAHIQRAFTRVSSTCWLDVDGVGGVYPLNDFNTGVMAPVDPTDPPITVTRYVPDWGPGMVGFQIQQVSQEISDWATRPGHGATLFATYTVSLYGIPEPATWAIALPFAVTAAPRRRASRGTAHF